MKKIGTGTKANTFSMTDEDRRIIDDAAAEWGCGSSEALRRILAEWKQLKERYQAAWMKAADNEGAWLAQHPEN